MTAIVEIAGRDSFAAAIKFSRENAVDTIYPTFAHTGTEFGDMEDVRRNVELLRRQLNKESGTGVDDLTELADYRLWRALNGRFISILIQKYGFYTPCIGCHLYVHLVRLPLTQKLGVNTLIAGEREYHEAGQKLNQTKCAIDAYKKVLESVGVDIVFPVRHLKDSSELMEYADWLWEEGGNQPQCVLSGNYRGAAGIDSGIDPEKQERFAEEFIVSVGKELASKIVKGDDDYIEIVETALKGQQ